MIINPHTGLLESSLGSASSEELVRSEGSGRSDHSERSDHLERLECSQASERSTEITETPEITFIPSPNFNARPKDCPIDLIVIHNISLPPGEFGGPYITDFFTNTLDFSQHPYFSTLTDKQVSCHCLIRRGGQIIQYVPFNERAWHAGLSCFEGRENCNDYSIGIELEGADEVPYTSEQYQVLGRLVVCLMETYKDIRPDRIVGHSAIAPDRKTDPGSAFDWGLLAQLLIGELWRT